MLPFNPDIANTFFWSGDIEAWGRSIQRVLSACREAGTPEPKIQVEPRDVWVEFPFSAAYLKIAEGPGDVGGGLPKKLPKKPPKNYPEDYPGNYPESAAAGAHPRQREAEEPRSSGLGTSVGS